jgi:hypothetical protein
MVGVAGVTCSVTDAVAVVSSVVSVGVKVTLSVSDPPAVWCTAISRWRIVSAGLERTSLTLLSMRCRISPYFRREAQAIGSTNKIRIWRRQLPDRTTRDYIHPAGLAGSQNTLKSLLLRKEAI